MQRIEKGQREIVAVRFGCLMKGIYQHSCGQNIAAYFMFASRHFFFSFSLDRFLPKFLFISFRWKDQIRSSVKIARQRFACQGISFCYLYWNIIRFRHSHIFISNSFSISISISISISLVLFSTKRERESDSFSIRFDSNRFRCDFGAWQNSTYASFNFMFLANPQHTQKWHTHSHTLTHANIESHTCTHSSHSGLSS